MNPNENHKFNGDYVTEFPMNNNAIFLGKFKYANGGLVKMQPGGPKDELAKFSKQPVNTNDPRYVGSQQAVQDKTRVVMPNVQAAKKEAPAVQNEIQRVKQVMEDKNLPTPADVYAVESNAPEGYVAKQVPGVLGSMTTVFVDPKTGEQLQLPQEVAQQQASMEMRDDADMLFHRLNPLTSAGAMAYYGANNLLSGDIAGGGTELLLSMPIIGPLIHGTTGLGATKGIVSEAVVPTLNKRLHQAYEVKHTAGTLKGAGKKEAGDYQGLPIQDNQVVERSPFIDSDMTELNKQYMQQVYAQNQNLPTTPFWMTQQGPKLAYGGDISVPDLKRVKIKSLPRSWKSQ
jgi:hypothetical protein